jgi:hypothetical protein
MINVGNRTFGARAEFKNFAPYEKANAAVVSRLPPAAVPLKRREQAIMQPFVAVRARRYDVLHCEAMRK